MRNDINLDNCRPLQRNARCMHRYRHDIPANKKSVCPNPALDNHLFGVRNNLGILVKQLLTVRMK